MSRLFARFLHMLSCVRTVTQQGSKWRCLAIFAGSLWFAPASVSAAAASDKQVHLAAANPASTDLQVQCLPGNEAFLRARLSGAIAAELSWTAGKLHCAGSVRPNAGGIRLRFSSIDKQGEPPLVLLFGITGLQEGASAKALPVNLTIMREGTGVFFATQGDNKCTVDEISQQPLSGIPLRQRAYRVSARGFCTQPARELNGNGLILVTRFDFVGRADFVSDDAPTSATQVMTSP